MIAVTYSSLSNVEWSECKLMWSYLILFRKFTNCVRKMVIRKMINTLSCIEHDRLRFPSFFGPLESSQSPSSCSIFFPWLSGFYRVVNHICRWSQTQYVAVFRGYGKKLKIRKLLKYFRFGPTGNIKNVQFYPQYCQFELKMNSFLEDTLFFNFWTHNYLEKTDVFKPIHELIAKKIFWLL